MHSSLNMNCGVYPLSEFKVEVTCVGMYISLPALGNRKSQIGIAIESEVTMCSNPIEWNETPSVTCKELFNMP